MCKQCEQGVHPRGRVDSGQEGGKQDASRAWMGHLGATHKVAIRDIVKDDLVPVHTNHMNLFHGRDRVGSLALEHGRDVVDQDLKDGSHDRADLSFPESKPAPAFNFAKLLKQIERVGTLGRGDSNVFALALHLKDNVPADRVLLVDQLERTKKNQVDHAGEQAVSATVPERVTYDIGILIHDHDDRELGQEDVAQARQPDDLLRQRTRA